VARLIGVPELLDGDLTDEAALVANLRDLARINRLTGGTTVTRRAIDRLRAFGPVETVLDVGTGAADIPASLLVAARRTGTSLRITATDSRPEVLVAARAARPGLDRVAGLELAVADGRRLPYPDGAFDVTHASMVVHHLGPEDAVGFLRELRRVARVGIVVNDLIRGRWYWLGAQILVHTIARSRFTRHDGPLSVRRAYTVAELVALIAAAGLTTRGIETGFAGHRVAIAAR